MHLALAKPKCWAKARETLRFYNPPVKTGGNSKIKKHRFENDLIIIEKMIFSEKNSS